MRRATKKQNHMSHEMDDWRDSFLHFDASGETEKGSFFQTFQELWYFLLLIDMFLEY
jgi:hypothetical protein